MEEHIQDSLILHIYNKILGICHLENLSSLIKAESTLENT